MAARTKTSNPTKAETGFPGRPIKGMFCIFAKCQWFSGPHVDAPEIHFAVCFDHFFHKVKRANTHPSRGEDQIHFEFNSFFEQCLHRFVVIFCNAEPDHFCSCIFNQRGDACMSSNRGSCQVQAEHPLRAVHCLKRIMPRAAFRWTGTLACPSIARRPRSCGLRRPSFVKYNLPCMNIHATRTYVLSVIYRSADQHGLWRA